MDYWAQMITTVVCSVLASSGLWAIILKRIERKDAKTELLTGIAHDRIIFLGMSYINRGFITQDEYENLHTYLYEPYKKVTGGIDYGSADRVMKEVDRLPIRKAESFLGAKLDHYEQYNDPRM